MLGGAMTARAQTPQRPRVLAVLMGQASDSRTRTHIDLLRRGLADAGWTEGGNLRLDVRWSEGNVARGRELARELVQLSPDVILASGTSAIAALKQATQTVPLVFVIVNDPVAQGFVPSIAHPGGNITGFSYMDYTVLDKALDLLQQAAPAIRRIGFMFNPDTYPYYETYLQTLAAARQRQGTELTALRVRSESDIMDALRTTDATATTGLMVAPDSFTTAFRVPIIGLAAQYRIPATYGLRYFVDDGGLMSYTPDISDIFTRSIAYIDRILKGARPGDLAIQAPTRTEFVINMTTAKALGLALPPTLVALADDVVE